MPRLPRTIFFSSAFNQPQALRSAAAFHVASATSDSGLLSIVMPPPATTVPLHPSVVNLASRVLIIIFHMESPLCKSIHPIEPVQNDLGRLSNSSIAAHTTVFGQPVILPPGKSACSAEIPSFVSSSIPVIWETKCWTFE